MKIRKNPIKTKQKIIYVHEEKTYLNETFISWIFKNIELSLYFKVKNKLNEHCPNFIESHRYANTSIYKTINYNVWSFWSSP
jgi:hypothetical protein